MCDQAALASGLALARARRAGGFSAGAERLNWGTRAARPANLMIRTIRVIRAQRPRLRFPGARGTAGDPGPRLECRLIRSPGRPIVNEIWISWHLTGMKRFRPV